ncbi:unnamed protein product, partial [Mesorhabditis spiculigera]
MEPRGVEFYKKLPKIELHAHLNGSLSAETIAELDELKKQQSNGTYHGLTDEERAMTSMDRPMTLAEGFKIFPIIQSLTQTPEAVKHATTAVLKDFEADGVRYIELRSTPKSIGMTKKEYIQAVISGMEDYELGGGTTISRFIVSIDRRQTLEEAKDTVELALAAESEDHLEEVDAFLELCPDRIGHGTFLHRREEWVRRMIELRIPLEICLSSNLLTKTTPSLADSHFQHWRQNGQPVTLATDDKGLFCSPLSNEFRIAAKEFRLDAGDCLKICQASLDASFLDSKSAEYRQVQALLSNFSYE